MLINTYNNPNPILGGDPCSTHNGFMMIKIALRLLRISSDGVQGRGRK